MTTQGILSIVNEKGDVIFKAVAGANGFNVSSAAEHIQKSKAIKTLDYVFKVCSEYGMESLVVMDKRGGVKDDGILQGAPLPELYKSTFSQPRFNPRRERGTADYIEVVEVSGMYLRLAQ